MQASSGKDGVSEWRTGWPTVAGAMAAAGTYCFHAYSLGALMTPLERETGWSRATIASSLTMTVIALLATGPIVGALVDRFGTRRVGLPGIWLYGLALAAIGACPPVPAAWIASWLVAGIFFSAASTIVWTRAVAMRFERSRGLALAITLSGAGLAQTFVPPLTVALTPEIGWRATYVALGALAVAISFPLNFFLLREEPAPVGSAVPTNERTGLSFREAMASSTFWRLAIVLALVAGAVGALNVHIQPIMIGAGLDAATAAGFTALIGPSLIIGRLSGGYLIDRIDPRKVATVAFGMPAIACLLLSQYDGSAWRGIMAATVIGLAAGVEADMIAFLTCRYFGTRNYGAIFGVLFGLFGLGSSAMPVLVAHAYDITGRYNEALIACAAGAAIGAILMGTLGKWPDFGKAVDVKPGAAGHRRAVGTAR